MNYDYKEVKHCRVCGNGNLKVIWTGGNLFVVDFPEDKLAVDRGKCPLNLCVCDKCWLVQLTHSVNPELLYRKFFYRSATNEMMRTELKDIATQAGLMLTTGDCVLDIGCNDGTLLKFYPTYVKKIGIDPAANIQHEGWQGVLKDSWGFVNDFFPSEKVAPWAPYKAITAIAMFYDLDDPVAFCKEVKNLLHPEGVFIVQMNYLPAMLKSNGMDNICHEHLTYFSLTSLIKVFEIAGLDIFHAELNDTNGGSLRVCAGHKNFFTHNPSVWNIMQAEERMKLDTMEPYQRFEKQTGMVLNRISHWLDVMGERKKKVYAYGASTRGTTLLQLLDVDGKIVACAERDPNKFGRYMVGSWIPIVSEEEARQEADYFMVLPWHFIMAIRVREFEWMQKGGRLMVPLPTPQVEWLGNNVPYAISVGEDLKTGVRI